MEDSTACIHGSLGKRSRAIARSPVGAEDRRRDGQGDLVPGNPKVHWDEWVGDYEQVRDAIERTYPDDFARLQRALQAARRVPPRTSRRADREWKTDSGKANFIAPEGLEPDPDIVRPGGDVFTLMTLRSNDQFNTTVYGYDDRLRGIQGTRMVLMMNQADIQRMGLAGDRMVDLFSAATDGVERSVRGLRIVPYSIPEGNCAGYFPELNRLIPLSHRSRTAHVPAGKSVPVRIAPAA